MSIAVRSVIKTAVNMSITSGEYRELLSFFANESAAGNIVSLALTQFNDSAAAATLSSGFALISGMAELNLTLPNDTAATDGGSNSSSAVGGGIADGGSTKNRTSMAAGKPRLGTEMPIWLIPCYSIILFFAIIGNLLVISTLVQNRRMRTITNLFLLNLAISDILLGVLCMPVTLVGTLLRHFIFGEFFCKLIQFSQAISVAVSSWTLVAISCERYYAICHPLRSRTWQTLNHAYRIIGFIWFGSILCMTPIAIFSQLMPTSRQGLRKCREHWPKDSLAYERSYNIFLDLVLLVLPLMILCFAYILITRTLYVGMKNERAMIFGSSCAKVGNEVESLTSSLTQQTLPPPTTGFQFSISFRSRGRSCGSGRSGNCGGGGIGLAGDVNQPSRHKSKSRQQQQQQQQQQSYDDYTQSGHKRKLLTATDGRRHLYCMRTASVKSLNHNNNDRGGSTPSASMTVINVPQQQRFKLYQHRQQQQQQQQQQMQQQYQQHQDGERRKSNSTPSLRISADTALRRSNKTKSLESKKRVIKMLFVLVLEFFICWTPLYVINTVAMFIGNTIYEYVDYTSISFFQLLAYSSSCCNPITYCFMNAGFRRAFLDTFKGLQLSGALFGRKNSTSHSAAGNSIIMANSTTMMTTHTTLDSPRL